MTCLQLLLWCMHRDIILPPTGRASSRHQKSLDGIRSPLNHRSLGQQDLGQALLHLCSWHARVYFCRLIMGASCAPQTFRCTANAFQAVAQASACLLVACAISGHLHGAATAAVPMHACESVVIAVVVTRWAKVLRRGYPRFGSNPSQQLGRLMCLTAVALILTQYRYTSAVASVRWHFSGRYDCIRCAASTAPRTSSHPVCRLYCCASRLVSHALSVQCANSAQH